MITDRRALRRRAHGCSRAVRKGLRYVFPDHWSFLLGEVALYAFMVLVATGIYLALFFDPSLAKVDLPRDLRAAARARDERRPTGRSLDISFTSKRVS